MKKVLLAMVLVVMTTMAVNAQQDIRSMYWSPAKHEKVLGSHSISFSPTFYKPDERCYSGYSDQEIFNILLNKAKQVYPNHTNLIIRNAEINRSEETLRDKPRGNNKVGPYLGSKYYYQGTFSVVVEDTKAKTNINAMGNLYQSVNKALTNIPIGARLAIDQITVPYSLNSDDFKDQLLDILIDKGYRVVAKEYLQKLKEEIDGYGSGLYNPDTAVKPDNFSAVGYFINVKVTETSIRVQVVNVSTGEYEGNATVNF